MKKCPNCTAKLKYNKKNKLYECEYCRGKFNLIQNVNKEDLYFYECTDCGANILVGPNVDVKSCIYCNSKNIEKRELDDEYNPGRIIPFKYSKSSALSIFRNSYKGKFVPNEFRSRKKLNNIYGIYIPTLLYNFNAYGEIEFNCEKNSHWKNGNYNYTKKDLYKAVRKGSIKLESISVYSKDNIIDSIGPYDYDDIKEYKESDLNGFFIEEFNLSKNDSNKIAHDKAQSSFIKRFKKDLIGYNNISINSSSIDIDSTNKVFVLLPVWVLNIKYKNKLYKFFINGETGKMIGNVPFSRKKFIITLIISFVVTFILLFIFYYMKVNI